jgi:hypothetical protein
MYVCVCIYIIIYIKYIYMHIYIYIHTQLFFLLKVSTYRNLSEIIGTYDINFQNYTANFGIENYRSLNISIINGGVVHGLVSWFNLCVDVECDYSISNGPGLLYTYIYKWM